MLKLYSASRYRDDVTDFADSTFQVLAAQISANYLKFIKDRIIPELGEFSNIPLRELRTLMAIAQINGPVKGTQISRILSYDPASVTRSTKWLIKNDFISKEDNHRDARSAFFILSRKGVRLSELYREVSWRASIKLNGAELNQPSQQDVLKALSVLEKICERSRFAAKLAADYKQAAQRHEDV